MPIKQAAMKALRQAKTRTARNAKMKEGITFLRKTVRKAIEAKELKKAADQVKASIKAIDKAVQKKVLKKNAGARIKSRLMKGLNRAAK